MSKFDYNYTPPALPIPEPEGNPKKLIKPLVDRETKEAVYNALDVFAGIRVEKLQELLLKNLILWPLCVLHDNLWGTYI